MARPTFVARGTLVEQSTGATLVCPKPAGWAVDDVLKMTHMHNNAGSATPTNWTRIGEYRNSAGKSMSIYLKRAVASEPDPTVSLSGGGSMGNTAVVMEAYRGCKKTGTPWEAQTGGTDSTVDTNWSTGAITSLGALRLMVASGITSGDTGGARWSNPGGANVANVQERVDQGWTQGLGGAVGCWSAEKDVAGSGCTITATKDVTSPESWFAAFLIPEDPEDTVLKATQAIMVG